MYNITINWYDIINTIKEKNKNIPNKELRMKIKKELKAKYFFSTYELEQLEDEIWDRLPN